MGILKSFKKAYEERTTRAVYIVETKTKTVYEELPDGSRSSSNKKKQSDLGRNGTTTEFKYHKDDPLNFYK